MRGTRPFPADPAAPGVGSAGLRSDAGTSYRDAAENRALAHLRQPDEREVPVRSASERRFRLRGGVFDVLIGRKGDNHMVRSFPELVCTGENTAGPGA